MFQRTPKFYLGVVGALLAAGFVVAVTAAASGLQPVPAAAAAPTKPSSTPVGAQAKAQAYCDSFVNHLASNLGKKPDQVKKAITDSLDQTLADAVKAGDITQQQADAIKAKRNGNPVCAGALAGIGRAEHGGAKAHAGLAEIAKALGISPQ